MPDTGQHPTVPVQVGEILAEKYAVAAPSPPAPSKEPALPGPYDQP